MRGSSQPIKRYSGMSAAVDVYRCPETKLERSSPNVNVTPQTLPTKADLLRLGEVTDETFLGGTSTIFLTKPFPSAEMSIQSSKKNQKHLKPAFRF